MKHLLFKENPNNTYEVAILIKESAMKEKELRSNYVTPLVSLGLEEDSIIAFNLTTTDSGTAPVKHIKSYLSHLLSALNSLGSKMILVADSAYFKVLVGKTKSEQYNGYSLPCVIKGYEHMQVVLCTNYQALFYNPDLQSKVTLALETVANKLKGTHVVLGSGIIHSDYYPDTLTDIQEALQKLLVYPELTCDIETFGLKFYDAGIGTIAFAIDQNNGIAFPCDYSSFNEPIPNSLIKALVYGKRIDNKPVKQLLRTFFEAYTGKLIWHNANFDVKIIIYELWMENLQDAVGLIKGLEVMTRLLGDTKIIAYLATNSCAGNDLKLKNLAHPFAGNYAQDDIKDITLIPLPELLKYNLTDCLATWYVYNTYYPKMVQDNQLNIYETIMLPSIRLLLFIELNGMPIDMDEVVKVKELFLSIQATEYANIQSSQLIQEYTKQLQKEAMIEKNLLLKVKVKPIEDFAHVVFNPGSNLQLQKLLHDKLGLEVTDRTDTGQPATGSKILKKHIFKLMNEFGITEEELL